MAKPDPIDPAVLDQPVIRTHEVAAILRYSHDYFLNKRRALEAQGFPKPILGNGYYATAAVLAWINRDLAPPPAPANDCGPASAAAADAELERRIAAMADEGDGEGAGDE